MLEAKREVNARLVTYLETQAGAWFRARSLRAYLRALRRRVPQGLRVKVRDGEPLDFLDWAESYINAMDPLHEAPRIEEFEREDYSWRAAEEAKAEFSRLSGHDWADPGKSRRVLRLRATQTRTTSLSLTKRSCATDTRFDHDFIALQRIAPRARRRST